MPSIVKSLSHVVADHVLSFDRPPAVLFRVTLDRSRTIIIGCMHHNLIVVVALPDALRDAHTRREIEQFLETAPYNAPTVMRCDADATVLKLSVSGEEIAQLPVGSPACKWWSDVKAFAQKGDAFYKIAQYDIKYVRDLWIEL